MFMELNDSHGNLILTELHMQSCASVFQTSWEDSSHGSG